MPGEKEEKTEKRWKGKRKANGRANTSGANIKTIICILPFFVAFNQI